MKGTERELRSQLMQMTLGYWRSQVLFAASEIGVFGVLRDGSLSAREVAERCHSSPAHTARLLDACAALGLLDKIGEGFQNARLATTFLLEGGPQYMGHWVNFMGSCYQPWGRLAKAIRTGKPVDDGRGQLGAGALWGRHLILAMHDYAMGPGKEMVNHVDLDGRARLLDVGGGPGSYSILLAQKHPTLKAVVLDLSPVVKIAQSLISESGLAHRVSVQEGDYLKDEFGTGYDVVLLSNVLQQEDPDAARMLLAKAHRALLDGGLLVIQAAFLTSEKTGPVWAVLQSLQLLLLYEGGRNYSIDETLAMLPDAGFSNPEVKKMSFLNAESLILATKTAR